MNSLAKVEKKLCTTLSTACMRTRPLTNRDTIRFRLSAPQLHMIRSIEKVSHRQWDMSGTRVNEYLGYLCLATH